MPLPLQFRPSQVPGVIRVIPLLSRAGFPGRWKGCYSHEHCFSTSPKSSGIFRSHLNKWCGQLQSSYLRLCSARFVYGRTVHILTCTYCFTRSLLYKVHYSTGQSPRIINIVKYCILSVDQSANLPPLLLPANTSS